MLYAIIILSILVVILLLCIGVLLYGMKNNKKTLDGILGNDDVTEEEIISMVREGHEQGTILASEAELIHNVFEFDDKEVKDINKVNGFINSCANISSDEFRSYMADTTKSEDYILKMNFGIDFGKAPDYDVFNPVAGQYEVIKYLVKCVLLDMRHTFMANKKIQSISFVNHKDTDAIGIIAERKYPDKNIVTLTIEAN